ncbi:MAG: hypothetical protein IM566_04185 [Pseudanabaena sp. M152S2SP2A07QC]|jgi:hypothetical protein|nr:hypothetical protein [Pseudanabaena sp. M109S1SP2A07QC]MCA6546622.1 hypothetical protein [Pseudanabaena sp. M152S2SP2A07QC]
MAKVEIRVGFDERKFARMIDLVPDHERGNGQNTKIIYYLVNAGIAALSAPPPVSKHPYSNKDYLRR